MNISIKEFLKFGTFDYLFENIPLINHPEIERALKEEDPKGQQVVIDEFHCAWPLMQWINEVRRKERIDKILTEMPKPIIVDDDGDIKQLIAAALKRGDFKELLRLKLKQLEQKNYGKENTK